jgi:ABC-2 type transport system ATP-binding protein
LRREDALIAYRVQDLVKRYRSQSRPANAGISFDVEAGQIFGILGDNGAGKSTLVRQMVNLLRRTSGSIHLFGEPVEKRSTPVGLLVGYMPQEADSLNRLTVGEALYFTAHLRGLSRKEARRERDRLLELWQLTALRDHDNAELSGGQRRLVRLATAMAGSPPVLLLDEPTNNLDPLRRRLVWNVLQSTHRDHGTTILFITHDALEAEKVVQRVAILHQGKLIAIGRPADLKRNLGSKLRIDLRFQPESPPAVPSDLACDRQSAEHWVVLTEWPGAIRLLTSLAPERLEDFRMQSPSLEDLYIHYVQET